MITTAKNKNAVLMFGAHRMKGVLSTLARQMSSKVFMSKTTEPNDVEGMWNIWGKVASNALTKDDFTDTINHLPKNHFLFFNMEDSSLTQVHVNPPYKPFRIYLHPEDAEDAKKLNLELLYGNYMQFQLQEIERDIDMLEDKEAVNNDPALVFRPQERPLTEEEKKEKEEAEKEEERFEEINADLFDMDEEKPPEKPAKRKAPDTIPVAPAPKRKRPIEDEEEPYGEDDYTSAVVTGSRQPQQPAVTMDMTDPEFADTEQPLSAQQKIALFRAKQQIRWASKNNILMKRLTTVEPDIFKNMDNPEAPMNLDEMSFNEIMAKRSDVKTGLSVYNVIGGIHRQYNLITRVLDAIGTKVFGFEGPSGVEALFQQQIAMQTFEKLGKVNPYAPNKPTMLDRILEVAEPSAEALYTMFEGAKYQQRIKRCSKKAVSQTALERYKQMFAAATH